MKKIYIIKLVHSVIKHFIVIWLTWPYNIRILKLRYLWIDFWSDPVFSSQIVKRMLSWAATRVDPFVLTWVPATQGPNLGDTLFLIFMPFLMASAPNLKPQPFIPDSIVKLISLTWSNKVNFNLQKFECNANRYLPSSWLPFPLPALLLMFLLIILPHHVTPSVLLSLVF